MLQKLIGVSFSLALVIVGNINVAIAMNVLSSKDIELCKDDPRVNGYWGLKHECGKFICHRVAGISQYSDKKIRQYDVQIPKNIILFKSYKDKKTYTWSTQSESCDKTNLEVCKLNKCCLYEDGYKISDMNEGDSSIKDTLNSFLYKFCPPPEAERPDYFENIASLARS